RTAARYRRVASGGSSSGSRRRSGWKGTGSRPTCSHATFRKPTQAAPGEDLTHGGTVRRDRGGGGGRGSAGADRTETVGVLAVPHRRGRRDRAHLRPGGLRRTVPRR